MPWTIEELSDQAHERLIRLLVLGEDATLDLLDEVLAKGKYTIDPDDAMLAFRIGAEFREPLCSRKAPLRVAGGGQS